MFIIIIVIEKGYRNHILQVGQRNDVIQLFLALDRSVGLMLVRERI